LTALLTAGWLATLFATLLSPLLTFTAAALITLTARSLLTATRLPTLIFFSIVCHDFPPVFSLIKRMRSSAFENRIDLSFAAFIQNKLQQPICIFGLWSKTNAEERKTREGDAANRRAHRRAISEWAVSVSFSTIDE
jgi:hypothetical protein